MSTKPPPQANARAIYAQSLWHFFAPIRPLLEDASVSEVMINGPDITYIERDGKLEPSQHTFADADALAAALHNLAQFNGRVLNAERPILEGHLPDGSRVEAVLPPAAPTGPCVAIRRFRESRLSVDDLVRFASLSAEAAAFLHALVHCKQNILVAGGTGSGKTSMLNALSSFIPPAERSVVIEDTAELQLQQPHVVQLLARPADAKGRGRITIRDLFRATLRLRPDRIVVGEIRGGEALDLLQAMTSGHGGCLSTIHATYPKDVLSRLETMAMMSDVELPLAALRSQIASAAPFIVQTARLQDGKRVVTHITELVGHDPHRGYQLRDIFLRSAPRVDTHGRVHTHFHCTGEAPSCAALLQGAGFGLPYETTP